MRTQSQIVDGNKVAVKLYADFEKNTNYEFTTADAKTVLEVGSLEIVDIKLVANSTNPLADGPVYPATTNVLRAYAYAKDTENNAILLGEITNDYDLKLRLATEDNTKAYVSGNNLTITKDGDTVTVSAEYGKVNVSKSFTATAAAAYKFVSIEEISLKGASSYDSTKWQANNGTISIPKDEHNYQTTQPRLDIVVKDTLGKYLITNNVVGRSNTKVIDQVQWDTTDNRRLIVKYESKNPNILMVSANDGTLYPVAEGHTEIVVSVTVEQGATTDTYTLGVIPVTVTAKRKLSAVALQTNDFTGVLNSGNFTCYTFTWTLKDQYGEAYLSSKVETDSKEFQENTVAGKKEAWSNNYYSESWGNGYVKTTVDANGIKASDNAWTFKLVLKDKFNSNAKTTTYAYVKVVDSTSLVAAGQYTISDADKYYAQTLAKIDALTVGLNRNNTSNQANVRSAGTGSYTLNYINYDSYITMEDDIEIAVVSYYKGLPLLIEDFAFVRKDGTDRNGDLLYGLNDTAIKFNYGLDNIANSTKASQYSNEINMSMRQRQYNRMNLISVVKGTDDIVAFVVDGANKDQKKLVTAANGALTQTATASAANVALYNNVNSGYSVFRADVDENADTEALIFDTIDDIVKNNVKGTYTISLKAPVLNTALAANGDMTFKATETLGTFTLNVVDNSKTASAVVRANQSADCYDEQSIINALFDSWTVPVDWAGSDVTVYRKADGTISNALSVEWRNGHTVTATISIPMVDNNGYIKYDYSSSTGVTGIFVYKVKVTITDGDFTYTKDITINQYVNHIGR